MTGWFQRIFGGRSRALSLARRAELRGDLARAAALFARAGRSDEASRVRKTRALSILAAAADTPMTPGARLQLVSAGADLESLGENARAAEAYGRAQDVESQGRALARAGEIDSLDVLLDAERARAREGRLRHQGHDLFDMRVASGQRREAAELARSSTDDSLRARGRELEAARLARTAVRLRIRAQRAIIVLGDRVVLGRAPAAAGRAQPETEGEIIVGSAAVSRRHILFERREAEIAIRDLGSHNGTTVGGAGLVGDVHLGDRLDLLLGGEVTLVARRADDFPGCIAIEVTGVRYVAPLGPARLGIGRWRLEYAGAGDIGSWVELVTDDAPPAFAAGLRLAARVSLVAGDAFSATRDGEAVIAFEE